MKKNGIESKEENGVWKDEKNEGYSGMILTDK